MLIASPRHTPADLDAWRRYVIHDEMRAGSRQLQRREDRAMDAIARFLADGPAYVGVSWGKDSVTVAHLVLLVDPSTPLVHTRRPVRQNPDCDTVRDAFLAMWPGVNYLEYESGNERSGGTVSQAVLHKRQFAEAKRRFGDRYISGVRGDESGERRVSARVHGVSTARACRPILWWNGLDVFAFLARHDLPVHPAYAMTMGGQLDRNRVRVGSIGGEIGRGHSRGVWERIYYPDVLEVIGADG